MINLTANIPFKACPHARVKNHSTGRKIDAGFTLVEVLVTLLILLLLAGVALPVTKTLIKDQRHSRATRSIVAFIENARSQAIAEEREMGILVTRLGTQGFSRAVSIELKQLRGLPTYTGESARAVATLIHDPSWPDGDPELYPVANDEVNAARFDAIDSQMLLLSAIMIENDNEASAPIRKGDLLELPGGRIATIRRIRRETGDPLSNVIVNFYLRDPEFPERTLSTVTYPHRPIFEADPPQAVPYVVHRLPTVSNSRTLSLPRGIAIDFNESGIGIRGNQFAPNLSNPGAAAADLMLFFDSKGRLSRVSNAVGNVGPPTGQIFLLVGELDGVRETDLATAATAQEEPPNLLRDESAWIVINPQTGIVQSAPTASVSTLNSITTALAESRYLANLGDTQE